MEAKFWYPFKPVKSFDNSCASAHPIVKSYDKIVNKTVIDCKYCFIQCMNLRILNSFGFIDNYSSDSVHLTVAEEDLKMIEKAVKGIVLTRIWEPLDIVKGIVFLSSIDAQFITGANLVIDGEILYN